MSIIWANDPLIPRVNLAEEARLRHMQALTEIIDLRARGEINSEEARSRIREVSSMHLELLERIFGDVEGT